MNLYLLDLVRVFSDLLVFIHILNLKLSLNIKLEGLYKVLVGVLERLLLAWILRGLLLLLQQPALVLVQLMLNLVLNVVEVQRRNSWVGVLSNLDLNFLLLVESNNNLNDGYNPWLLDHVLDITLNTLDLQAWRHHLRHQRIDLGWWQLVLDLLRLSLHLCLIVGLAKTLIALPEALVVLIETSLARVVLVAILRGVVAVDGRLVGEGVQLSVVVIHFLISPALLLALVLLVEPWILIVAASIAALFFIVRLIVSLLIFLAVSSLELLLRVLLLIVTTRAETVLILMAILGLVSLGRGLLLTISFLHDLVILIMLPLLVSISHGPLFRVLIEDLPAAIVVLVVVLVVVVVVASSLVVMVLITSLVMFSITVIPIIHIILVILRVAPISILLVAPVAIVPIISIIVARALA
jgi:hypothetical protein